MARWTVQDGDQLMVIETAGDQVTVDIPSGPPFVTGRDGARDIRVKLGLAMGALQAITTEQSDHEGHGDDDLV